MEKRGNPSEKREREAQESWCAAAPELLTFRGDAAVWVCCSPLESLFVFGY